MTIEENLKKNLLTIPNPPGPVGNYVAYNQTGNLIFISGQLPIDEKGEMIKGKIGKDLNIEQGKQAAKLCILNEKFKIAYSNISKNIKNIPELIIYCNLSYRYISNNFIIKNLKRFVSEGCDTLIPVIEDFSVNWRYNYELENYIPISKNLKNRKYKKPILKSLFGLGTITNFVNMKSGDLITGNYKFNIVNKQESSLRN